MAFPLRLLLLLLLVLAAVVPIMGGSATSDLDTICPADTTITDMDVEETINWKHLGSEELEKDGFVYMYPGEGFQGVSLRAVLNSYTPPSTSQDQETHDAFFHVSQDTCFKDSTAWWWEVYQKVWVISSKSNEDHYLHFYLRAGRCRASCTVHLHSTNYQTLAWPVVVAHGPSRWTLNPNEKNCKTERHVGGSLQEYKSCLKPPGTTQDTTAALEDIEDTYNYTIAMMITLTVLTVTFMLVAYCVGKEVDHITWLQESYSSG